MSKITRELHGMFSSGIASPGQARENAQAILMSSLKKKKTQGNSEVPTLVATSIAVLQT